MSGGRFKPGQSGNPGGRVKEVAHVRELARQHTEAAIKTLVEIMGSETEKGAARVAAAQALLDRGYGKPMQSVEHSGPDGGAVPGLVVTFVKADGK